MMEAWSIEIESDRKFGSARPGPSAPVAAPRRGLSCFSIFLYLHLGHSSARGREMDITEYNPQGRLIPDHSFSV